MYHLPSFAQDEDNNRIPMTAVENLDDISVPTFTMLKNDSNLPSWYQEEGTPDLLVVGNMQARKYEGSFEEWELWRWKTWIVS